MCFLQHYTRFLEKIKSKKIFICGYFNIDIIKSELDCETSKFLDLVFSFRQYPLIAKPTRITNKSCAAIDNICTNVLDENITSNILIDDITDHLPILCVLKEIYLKHTKEMNMFKKRKLNARNIALLNDLLENTTWDEVCNTEDVNCAYKMFMKKIVDLFDKCCPIVGVTTKIRRDKTWMTKGLINACNKKNYLYKCQLGNSNEIVKKRYVIYKNRLTAILRKAEKQFYIRKLSEYKGNMKNTWAIVNNLIGRGNKKLPFVILL